LTDPCHIELVEGVDVENHRDHSNPAQQPYHLHLSVVDAFELQRFSGEGHRATSLVVVALAGGEVIGSANVYRMLKS